MRKKMLSQNLFPRLASGVLASIIVVAGASIILPEFGKTFTDTDKQPPNGNVEPPINEGPDDQWKEGSLGVGINEEPSATLDVGGDIQSSGTITSDTVTANTLVRTNILSLQNGPLVNTVSSDSNLTNVNNNTLVTGQAVKTYINDLVAGNAGSFNFVDKNKVSSNTQILSNTQTITNTNNPSFVTIRGQGNPEYKIGNSEWQKSNETGAIFDNQNLRVRLTSGDNGESRTANVYVGNETDQWTVTSRIPTEVNSFNFRNVNNVDPNTLVTSNRKTITGTGGPFPISISGPGNPQYRIDSGNWTSSAGQINSGQNLQLRINSASSGNSRTATVNINDKSDAWRVTTKELECNSQGEECSDGTVYVNADTAILGPNHPYYDSRKNFIGRLNEDAPFLDGTPDTKTWSEAREACKTKLGSEWDILVSPKDVKDIGDMGVNGAVGGFLTEGTNNIFTLEPVWTRSIAAGPDGFDRSDFGYTYDLQYYKAPEYFFDSCREWANEFKDRRCIGGKAGIGYNANLYKETEKNYFICSKQPPQ